MDKIKKIFTKECTIFAFLAFLVGIYAPFEMYITNPTEFWFSIKHFMPLCIIVSLLIFLCCTLIHYILPEKFRETFEWLIFALECAIYVQGTFLNIDIGQLTGISFASKTYILYYVRDAVAWIIIFGVVAFFYKKKRDIFEKVMVYFPAFLLITLMITSITLFINAYKDEAKKSETTAFNSEYRLTTLGKDENIIVFVLDMFDSRYLNTIANEYSDALNEFDGFTIYDNYTGGYATTSYSLAFLNSGKYFRNEKILDDAVNERESYIDTLRDAGYDTANYGSYGFPGRTYIGFSNFVSGVVKVRNPLKFIFHIYEMGAFRYAPNICKVEFMKFTDKLGGDQGIISEYNMYDESNIGVYNSFCNNPMQIEDGKCFKLIYTRGTHYPYVNNENLEEVASNEDHPIECAIGVLKMVEKYISEMKKTGVYDNSTIIITADHGYFSDYGMDEFSKPILMIKKMNSHGEVNYNSSPVSQEDFAATIEGIATGEEINRFGKSIFAYNEDDVRDRFYYHYYLKEKGNARRLIEFKINNDSNVKNAFELTGNEYTIHGNVINHFEYCKSCQTGDHDGKGECWHVKADNYPDERTVSESILGN